MKYKYQIGDKCRFNTTESTLSHLDGQNCVVYLFVDENEVDEEVGPMYVIEFENGDYQQAFEDELTAI